MSMEAVIKDLTEVLLETQAKLATLSEQDFSMRPAPGKWSRKEVMGHLADSAHNNLRRFICAQYEQEPPKIIYDQDYWVKVNGYQEMTKNDVITLWRILNEQILRVLKQTPPAMYEMTCNTGKENRSLHTIEWLAQDYVLHMKHHINQVFPGTYPVRYPA